VIISDEKRNRTTHSWKLKHPIIAFKERQIWYLGSLISLQLISSLKKQTKRRMKTYNTKPTRISWKKPSVRKATHKTY